MSLAVWHALFPSTMLFVLVCLGVLAGGTIRAFTGFGGENLPHLELYAEWRRFSACSCRPPTSPS